MRGTHENNEIRCTFTKLYWLASSIYTMGMKSPCHFMFYFPCEEVNQL